MVLMGNDLVKQLGTNLAKELAKLMNPGRSMSPIYRTQFGCARDACVEYNHFDLDDTSSLDRDCYRFPGTFLICGRTSDVLDKFMTWLNMLRAIHSAKNPRLCLCGVLRNRMTVATLTGHKHAMYCFT